jgi:N-acetylglucosaminyl-diphospho-decaprenol L-rhamnosyltransferase
LKIAVPNTSPVPSVVDGRDGRDERDGRDGRDGMEPIAKLEAVVVDHKAGDVLRRCVSSLEIAGVRHVVVVDNAVPPGRSRQTLASPPERPVSATRMEILETGTNLGYGAGVNRGAAACSAEFLLVSNADVTFEPTALTTLVESLKADQGLAIVGPRVNEPDGTRYPSARRFPSLLQGAGHALAGVVAPNNRFTRRYRMEELAANRTTTTKVDWVSGSCFLARRQAFEELGGFDESYFMYAEDVDLCWRAHRAGWGVAYVPEAAVTHVRAVSTNHTPYRMLVAHHRSTLRFASRTISGPRKVVLPAVAVALGVRLVIQAGRQAISSGAGRRRSEVGPSDD